jgi:isopenicillin N synthase-like dioxygenase
MGEPLPNNTLEQPLPTPLAPHQQTIVNFQNSCHAMCQRIFAHLATALATPPDWFTSRHDRSRGPSGTVFRMLYYPALTPQDGDENEDRSADLRAGAHSDFGSLTLLFQLSGQPGLEIKTPEGEWASVPVDPSSSGSDDNNKDDAAASLPILLNIGDLLEDVSSSPLCSPHEKMTPNPPRHQSKTKQT